MAHRHRRPSSERNQSFQLIPAIEKRAASIAEGRPLWPH